MYDDLTDVEILARTAFGENRGGGSIGMQSVLNVIMNRANSGITWWGSTPREICLKPEQFSCWNQNDPNYQVIMNLTDDNTTYAVALNLATQALNGNLADLTSVSCYYIACGSPVPEWAVDKTPVVVIANQQFYNNIA